MRLREHDYRSLLKTLREVYILCDLETFPSKVLPAIMRTVSSDSISYNECDTNRQQVRAAWEPSDLNIAPDDLVQFGNHMHEHPVISLNRKGVYKISDFMRLDNFQRLGIFNEFYRKYDVNYQMSIMFTHANTVIGFAFNRNISDFSERDRFKLRFLYPHLLQAYNNATLITKARLSSEPLPLSAYNLSPREVEVLSWVAQGKTNFDVASILRISPRTVQKHLENIYIKLGVETRTAAAAFFLHNEAARRSKMEYV